MWRKHPIVADWQDVQIVPIPKKGDNWRGISLLDVVRKVFARIMQEWLQTIADNMSFQSLSVGSEKVGDLLI